MRTLIIATTAAATLFSSGAFAQQPSQSTESIPNFSGAWYHPSLPGFEPLAYGPTSTTNKSRRNGVSNLNQLVGDYTNPILKPEAAEVVKKHGETSLKGIGYPTPSNQCWPEPLPYIFGAITHPCGGVTRV